MSAFMSETFMSPDFLTKFIEEYRELPVLWQVRSAGYSNRAKRMRPEICSCSSRERKSQMLTCVLSGHHLGKNCAEFGIIVLSPLLQLASMNSFWILKCTSKVRSRLMRVW
jgi:hypothetical protein